MISSCGLNLATILFAMAVFALSAFSYYLIAERVGILWKLLGTPIPIVGFALLVVVCCSLFRTQVRQHYTVVPCHSQPAVSLACLERRMP